MLQNKRALEVARAVQPGAQAEVSFEQRARFSEQIEQFVTCGHGAGSIQFDLNRTTPPLVYSQDKPPVSLLMEHFSMRHVIRYVTWSVVLPTALAATALAQAPAQGAGGVRRLSVDDAVRLALEQNLGIQIDRLNPQIQDISVA